MVLTCWCQHVCRCAHEVGRQGSGELVGWLRTGLPRQLSADRRFAVPRHDDPAPGERRLVVDCDPWELQGTSG
jgi:hypothetical protein